MIIVSPAFTAFIPCNLLSIFFIVHFALDRMLSIVVSNFVILVLLCCSLVIFCYLIVLFLHPVTHPESQQERQIINRINKNIKRKRKKGLFANKKANDFIHLWINFSITDLAKEAGNLARKWAVSSNFPLTALFSFWIEQKLQWPSSYCANTKLIGTIMALWQSLPGSLNKMFLDGKNIFRGALGMPSAKHWCVLSNTCPNGCLVKETVLRTHTLL